MLKWSEWHYGPQTRLFTSLQGNFYKPTILYDNFRITSAYQFIKEDRITRKFQSDQYNNTYVDVHVLSNNIDFVKGNFLYGFEGVHNIVNSTATEGTQPRYPSGGSSMSTLAAYSSYKQIFSSSKPI